MNNKKTQKNNMNNNIKRKPVLLSEQERKELKDRFCETFKNKYSHLLNPYPFGVRPTRSSIKPAFADAHNPLSLKNVDLKQKQMSKILIDPLRKSVICGTCISDSSLSINPGYRNARIQNRHSTRQQEWFFWKWLVCLRPFNKGESSITLQNPDGKQLKSFLRSNENFLGKLKISSGATEELTNLFSVLASKPVELLYQQRNKKTRIIISRSWLNHMTNYFLMTIWLDDGSLYNRNRGCICWDSTPRQEQKVFVDYLKSVWNVNAYVGYADKSKTSSRVYFKNTEDLLDFLRIIAPIIPIDEMLYKIQFVPVNNIDLLQRWASEVTKLVKPEFRESMANFYSNIIENYNELNKKYSADLTLTQFNSEDDIVQ